MSLWQRLKRRISGEQKGGQATETVATTAYAPAYSPSQEGYRPVPAYVEADSQEAELVSVIASAIAAGDDPDSQWQVKRVLVTNPEIETLSVIAAAIAAGDNPDSQWVVRQIYEK